MTFARGKLPPVSVAARSTLRVSEPTRRYLHTSKSMPTIFRKTAKGLSEIETRANRLPPRLRSMLILVDGKRDAGDLKRLVAQQADETLLALAEQGFIEAVGETLDRLDRLDKQGTPASKPSVDLLAVRRHAARALKEELGPSARLLVIRIERSRSAEELKPLLSQAVQLVVAARGRTAAAAFATRMPVL